MSGALRTSSSTEPAIGNPKPNTLSDVHGSAWITAGQGSVILLWGTAGAASVELSQIKPIRETVKTTTVNFNRSTGGVGGVDRRWVLLNLASMKETHSPPGFTIDDAVKAVHNSLRTDDTWKSHSAKVKRFLDKLVLSEELVLIPGQTGGTGGGIRALDPAGSKFGPSERREFGRKVRYAFFWRSAGKAGKAPVSGACLTFCSETRF
jgi:hypothetical protein